MALLDDYKKFLSERGKSENTIKTYSGHVNEYYRWYKDTFGEAPTLLYHTNILDFRSYLQNIKKLKFKSISKRSGHYGRGSAEIPAGNCKSGGYR